MRQFVRKQILDLLSTLWKGVWQSKTLCPQAAESVLTDCYLAVQTVEQALQNGLSRETFANYTELLGSLKELLEEIKAEISQGISVSDTTKKLKTELKQLRKMLSEEKEVKLEIVFFPYKASMWDSLESIWLAARNDENCDAYVVPIPYYDRKPDGSFGEMHYEGNMYPGYVPIVNWQNYNVEDRRPDVIFIHNPYDDRNVVTSVDPNYYNKRLRECTDLLVYVPYFVVSEDVLERVPEHFCTTLGCVYAHKIILQSEKVRDEYIRAFQKVYGDHFGNIKDKFVALGSPKFDKVMNMQQKDYTLSEVLKSLIAGKKVILYNTSISTLLRDSEQYFIKMQDVLDVFRQRKDVVLWWRPHPLLGSTLDSMRPTLGDAYRKIVKKYQEETYGILDDSADVDRAVTFSDAYYGDAGSSVEAMYQATGKPIMEQNIQIKSTDKPVLLPRALAVNQTGIYFSIYGKNTLFHMNPKTGIVNQLGKCKESYSPMEFYSANECQGKIYFSPSFSKKIVSYDYNSDKIFEIYYKEKKWHDYGLKFHRGYGIGKFVYFVGYTYPIIMRLDTENNEIRIYNDWFSEMNITEESIRGECWFYDSCVADNSIAFVSYSTPKIVIFDTIKRKSRVYHLRHYTDGYSGICYDGENYWLIPFDMRYIAKWNPQSNLYKEYTDFPLGFKNDSKGVWGSFSFANNLYLLPNLSNMILKVNKDSGEISCVKMFDSTATLGSGRYTEYSVYNNKAYLAPYCGNEIEILNLDTEEFNTVKMNLDLIDLSVLNIDLEARKTDWENKPFQEAGLVSIQSFINAVCKQERKIEPANKRKINSGDKIYNDIRRVAFNMQNS